MYHFLKKIVKAIIPKRFLFKNEPFFRFFYGIFFIGTKHKCTICNHKLSSFVSDSSLCPFCGSLPRSRRLWKLLNEDRVLNGKVLHFSPSRSLYRKLKKNKTISYFSSDFEDEFLADHKFDITNIDQPDNTFELIICYHILEHIIDDSKAMSELFRVLAPSGKIYLQTPFKEGTIYEDFSITSPQERKLHFGQEDHVRVYSIEGLKQRLKTVGFDISVRTFVNSEKSDYFGLYNEETILILSK